MKTKRRLRSMSVLTALVMLLPACGGSGGTPQDNAASSLPEPASGNSSTGQVAISGAINKTYVPEEVTAVEIVDGVGISLYEEFPCGVLIQFPLDVQPGTYPIEDQLHQVITEVFGRYGELCDSDEGFYESAQGTLTLTTTGERFSGTFEFTAGNVTDNSKTIQVSGSFSDVSLP